MITGMLASSIPTVVPRITQKVSVKRAARTTVATWVLSPISARKNMMVVAMNAPMPRNFESALSSLSGTSSHRAMATKLPARIQGSQASGIKEATQAPSQADKA